MVVSKLEISYPQKMLNQVAGFIFRLFLGFFTFVIGVLSIVYILLWDFIREKILRRKPIENPCFEKVLHNHEVRMNNEIIGSSKSEKTVPEVKKIDL
ncbi:hypothetical protein [Aquimarina latercula]|uniref:hypothetical protein n=1 Tax=Aquimarina latercula TaxID=987 RepID=UPI000424DB70|nr:hypothetical protein [Aquimarina latercula]